MYHRCCQRFAQLAQDRTLWRRVDFRTNPILLDDLNQYMKFLQPITMSLAMRGNLICQEGSSLTQRFFNNVKTLCDRIKELIIEEYYINGDKVYFIEMFIMSYYILVFEMYILESIQFDPLFFFPLSLSFY